MTTPILATKLYVPPPRPDLVPRPRLVERLDEGLRRRLTLLSAPAGFGKTTLLADWLGGRERPAAWLSLDEGDNDPARFLTYLVAALGTIAPRLGEGLLGVLHSPQPPPAEAILTALLNEITAISEDRILVLDDYHVIAAAPIDQALAFLLDHLPPPIHLVISTREDPRLPLARLRARDHLTELRAADLRFTPAEAAAFLTQAMGLVLTDHDIAALESRTEGWIAGLQLAAVSLHGHPDATGFIQSFTGSHHFVTDYLVEEVLQRQPARVQAFLLRTAILERLCGALCDAVVRDPAAPGQATLEALDRANLFLVPLDDERRWYRYHHLFADLLRQRLRQGAAASVGEEVVDAAELHRRASQWLEEHGLELEAFHHAAAAGDIERAARLIEGGIEGGGMPLHFRGAVAPVLNWLQSLPAAVLDAWPVLATAYASVLLATGQVTGVEEHLRAAERALQGAEPDDRIRDLIGRIAAIRATVAVSRHQVEAIVAQSRRALEYLRPDNQAFRTSTAWKLAYAYQLQGDRAAARRAYVDVVAIGEASGNTMYTLLASEGLGMLQEAANQLPLAAETYRQVLQRQGNLPLGAGACEAHLGLARICHEWNDLDGAERHGQRSLQLARQYDRVVDRFIGCEIVLARLKLARGDVAAGAAMLARTGQSAQQSGFVHRMPEIAAAQVLVLLRQGDVAAAAQLARAHDLPLSQARVHLARGDPSAALAALEPWRRRVEAKGWENERLKVLVLQAVAFGARGEQDEALQALGDALTLAEPGGFIRTFVDEGPAMARLLSAAAAQGRTPDYIGTLVSAFDAEEQKSDDSSCPSPARPLVEPLSQRELEVLHLIAQGLSNQEIGERLFLAVDTVKGHNRRVFGKLQVQRRTEAVARARELGLL